METIDIQDLHPPSIFIEVRFKTTLERIKEKEIRGLDLQV